MVTDAIIKAFAAIAAAVMGALPHFAVPSWLTQAGSLVATITGALTGTSAWLPWTALGLAVALVLASVGIAIAIRGVRIAASFLTLGGGGA